MAHGAEGHEGIRREEERAFAPEKPRWFQRTVRRWVSWPKRFLFGTQERQKRIINEDLRRFSETEGEFEHTASEAIAHTEGFRFAKKEVWEHVKEDLRALLAKDISHFEGRLALLDEENAHQRPMIAHYNKIINSLEGFGPHNAYRSAVQADLKVAENSRFGYSYLGNSVYGSQRWGQGFNPINWIGTTESRVRRNPANFGRELLRVFGSRKERMQPINYIKTIGALKMREMDALAAQKKAEEHAPPAAMPVEHAEEQFSPEERAAIDHYVSQGMPRPQVEEAIRHQRAQAAGNTLRADESNTIRETPENTPRHGRVYSPDEIIDIKRTARKAGMNISEKRRREKARFARQVAAELAKMALKNRGRQGDLAYQP
ncbi:MAG: hypothetical protein V1835_03090 [Candidatus Micrarchaeota archaeon]